jgi:ectoine hydroxylase-related dioxygenase (phytanoyl-CoA dioxygenase family)
MKVMNISKASIDQEINEFGFCEIPNFFSERQLNHFEKCVVDLYLLQAEKIGEYRERAIQLRISDKSDFEKFSALYEMMEIADKEALYQVQKFLTSSQGARSIFDERFMSLLTELLRSSANAVLLDGPALFVNRPRTDRLLYKWHSEAHYYPKRRRFYNIWFPLFSDKNVGNGTMSFKTKSHLVDLPFADYQGFDKGSEGQSNYFIQYEIPSNLLSSFSEYFCEVPRTSLIIFHKNLVHRSNQNISDEYSVAVVARVWDPTDDLTLSGSIGATPYGGNIGRADFVVG